MSLPQSEQHPEDPERLPPARRRRARRTLIPLDADERAEFLDDLAHRASSSFDFFLFSLFAGIVIGLGVLTEAQSLLVFGALIAPLMAPVTGLSLGTITGSVRFFLRSLLGVAIACLLVFLTGLMWGLASQVIETWLPLNLEAAHPYAQLTWHNFLVLALSSIFLAISLVNKKQRAQLFSAAVAYELYIPLTAAGVGLSSGEQFLWPDGIAVFAMHLAWAALLGALTLAILGFRPLTLLGYTLGGVVTLIGIILLIGLTGIGAVFGGQLALPTPFPTPSTTPTLTLSPTLTSTTTLTPIPPSLTPTDTLTPSPTLPSTNTPSPSPTPVYAIISAPEEFGGANVRAEPGFQAEFITSVLNGTLVQILSDSPVEEDNVTWLQVSLPNGVEGWILESALLVATPAPNW